mmetsp:Transcript_32789/g.74128  ORF Transcript_32789/g.74128 Transcript_32789/m.74128 type:complete len:207 (-) Transcript_32789:223-843(-)
MGADILQRARVVSPSKGLVAGESLPVAAAISPHVFERVSPHVFEPAVLRSACQRGGCWRWGWYKAAAKGTVGTDLLQLVHDAGHDVLPTIVVIAIPRLPRLAGIVHSILEPKVFGGTRVRRNWSWWRGRWRWRRRWGGWQCRRRWRQAAAQRAVDADLLQLIHIGIHFIFRCVIVMAVKTLPLLASVVGSISIPAIILLVARCRRH